MIAVSIILISFLLAFFGVRDVCFAIVKHLMNKSSYKKRKKNMSFKEWFFMSRFRIEIPKYHIYIYYVTIILYFILSVSFAFAVHFNVFSDSILVSIYVFGFTVIWVFIYGVSVFGLHTNWTWINQPNKIRYRGVNKKEYMKKRKK